MNLACLVDARDHWKGLLLANRQSDFAAQRVAAGLPSRCSWTAAISVILLVLPGCSVLPRSRTAAPLTGREFTTTVLLHRTPLELHVSAPPTPSAPDIVVLYASGDGGWFGAAVDMFRQIADAGYPVAGFSSRAFLKIERPRGALVSAAQLAAEYEEIIAQARVALGLGDTSRVVLTGWSRGAAFSVLVGSEPTAQRHLLGVIAIGLSEGEDLEVNRAEDESDDGHASGEKRPWPFETYARIGQVEPFPCAVIQATHDNYLPAAGARQLFGPDTPVAGSIPSPREIIDFLAARRPLMPRFSTRFAGSCRDLSEGSGLLCIAAPPSSCC